MSVLIDLAALLVMPFFLTGLVNRTKSWWSGRRGPPIFQSLFDVLRLLRKEAVYSHTTTPLFRWAPWVFLITAVASALISPIAGVSPVVGFPFDFVWLAYAWGLGRALMMLAALDTGSAFEGMGAAREAYFAALLEPGLFVVAGALALSSGSHQLSELLAPRVALLDGSLVVWAASVTALFVVLQVEGGRIPVDDPTTHLELTMIHEVMILDHSGPELAAIQLASAVKLLVTTSWLASLISPLSGSGGPAAIAAHFAACALIAVAVGTVESLIARLRLRTVPRYVAVVGLAGVIALLGTAWRTGAGA